MVSIVIQAGGKSSRMGEDKGLVKLQDSPLISHVIKNLENLGDEMLITSNSPQGYLQFGLPVYEDEIKDYGALAGMATAFKAARHEKVVLVACDMPFADKKLFKYMLKLLDKENIDAVVPSTDVGYEPFHAVYRREICLPAVLRAIEKQKKRMISWFEDVDVYLMETSEFKKITGEKNPFFNINTPEELKLAESMSN